MKTNNNAKRRLESTKEYIDSLQKDYSKINIVRLDCGYTNEYSESTTLEDANKDVNTLLNNRRSKPLIFEHNIGYVLKREYTKDKGVHIHAVFIFDGNKVMKSSYKAEQIGKYWNEKITKNRGSYHNCHRNKYQENGIGIIEHRDKEKREIFDEKVISYLCKDEHDVTPVKKSKKDRAFTRGTVTKKDKNKVGRPRTKSA